MLESPDRAAARWWRDYDVSVNTKPVGAGDNERRNGYHQIRHKAVFLLERVHTAGVQQGAAGRGTASFQAA